MMMSLVSTRISRRLASGPRRREVGLSLVELMIAMALGLIIVAALVAVFANTSTARSEIERMSRQIENGRYAVEVLADELRHAGYYAQLSNTILPASGTDLTEAEHDPCSTNATHWAKAMNLHVLGYDASDGGLTCLAGHNYKAGTDVVVVRRVRTCAAGSAGCDAAAQNKPYLQVSLCATEAAVTPYKLALAPADPTTEFTLKSKGATPADCGAADAPTRQYVVNIYFISTDNGASPAQSIPTLKRLEFTGIGWTVTPLVEGIEALNVDYGVDCTASGTAGYGEPDAYFADPATAAGGTCTNNVNRWMNVLTARVSLLARNIEPSPGYTDTKTYALGSLAIPAQNDPYRRHAYSTVVRMNNPAGRRDTP